MMLQKVLLLIAAIVSVIATARAAWTFINPRSDG